MKVCTVCLRQQAIKEFATDAYSSTGYKARCKSCDRAKAKAYYESHRAECLAKIAAYKTTPEKQREYDRRAAKKTRERALAVYGNQCVTCGSTSDLEFDHVNNDGAAHRLTEQSRDMYRRIAKTGRLTDWDIQLLCRQCHLAKTLTDRKAMA